VERPIVIVDYGMGNIGSVANALERLGAACVVSDTPESLRQARGIVLPGVGAFPMAMENIRVRGLDKVLSEEVLAHRKPFLGICLGMQLIAKDSLELGYSLGLGWIDGHVLKIEPVGSYPVPHVGWNEVIHRPTASLFSRIQDGAHFFFDHSYHLTCASELVTATCEYGGTWVAGIQKENILAVQFHPEKSQRNGLRVLRNFLNMANAR